MSTRAASFARQSRRATNALRDPAGFLRRRLSPVYMARRLGKRTRPDVVRIGSDYGGWSVAANLIGPDSICYCAGVGEDVSFDLGLIERFGCHVWAFDPTPRAIAFVEPIVQREPRFHFQPVGLWTGTSIQRFYAPPNAAHVSHSITNLRNTETYFEAPCRRLSDLMRENGHDHIDLVKLDIEGAEYSVLGTLIEDGVFPAVIDVEFDQPAPLAGMLTASRKLTAAGYQLVAIDRWNYTFVRR